MKSRVLLESPGLIAIEAAPTRLTASPSMLYWYGGDEAVDRTFRCWTPYVQAVVCHNYALARAHGERTSAIDGLTILRLFCRSQPWSEDDPAVGCFPWPNIWAGTGYPRFVGAVNECGSWRNGLQWLRGPTETAVGLLNAYFTTAHSVFSAETDHWRKWMPLPIPAPSGSDTRVLEFFRQWSKLTKRQVLALPYLQAHKDLRKII